MTDPDIAGASRARMSEQEALTRLTAAFAGRYVLERELGRGAMARVFLARDVKHERLVAVKLLRPELAAAIGAERFLREIQVTAALQHPHILALYDSGEAGGLLYYVSPYVSGGSLRDRLLRERQLPVDEAVVLIRMLALALGYAHRQGVAHRDVKPENVLLQEGQPMLADFGIALALGGAAPDRLTATGITIGTPQYMSPEQAAGDRLVGPPSDIYALGAVAYELLTGEPPFTGAAADAVLARVLVDEPRAIRTVRRTVPASTEVAILRALAKAPADRFRTAEDFAVALGIPADSGSVAPAVPGRPQRTGTRRAVRVSVGVIAALGVVAAAFVTTRTIPEPNRSPAATRRQLTFAGDVMQPAISPDGQFVAYSTLPDGESYCCLVVQDLVGGAPDTVLRSDTTLSMMTTLEWSPDGSRLLLGYRSRALLGYRSRALVVRRTSGPPVGVAAAARLAGYVYASWLPDGERVSLHAEDARRALVVDLQTEDTVAVPVGGRYDLLLGGAWSPDGRLFAVASATGDPFSYAIRAVAPDGRTEVVAEDSVPLDSPRWSSEGDAIYYLRGAGSNSAVRRVAVAPRTGRPRGVPEEIHAQLEALPHLRTNSGGAFSLTRDGRRMVFARGRWSSDLLLAERPSAEDSAENERRSKRVFPEARYIHVWNTSNPWSSGVATLRRWSPAVSPDGRWIAFAQETRDGAELFRVTARVAADTTNYPSTQLTVGARVWPQVPIAWSPDGRQLAFASVRGGRARVWAADVEGGRLRPFEGSRVAPFSGALTWAPGARIAYRRSGGREIDLLDPASGAVRSVLLDSAPGGPVDLRFAPDGHRLAVRWGHPGAIDGVLQVFDFRDSSSITLDSGAVSPPLGWSADGRYVYVLGNKRDGWPAVYRVDTRRQRAPDRVAILSTTHVEHWLAGPRPAGAFIGTQPAIRSDVWMIENFDARAP